MTDLQRNCRFSFKKEMNGDICTIMVKPYPEATFLNEEQFSQGFALPDHGVLASTAMTCKNCSYPELTIGHENIESRCNQQAVNVWLSACFRPGTSPRP